MDSDVRQQLEAIPGRAAGELSTPHPVGTTVVIRSIRDFPDREPAVSFAVAGTVLQDDEDLIVVMTSPGSDRASRVRPTDRPARTQCRRDRMGRHP